MRSRLGVLEERGALLGVVAELVAKDPQGVGGITEAVGDLRAGQFLHKKGAQSLVLAVERGLRAEEEAGLVGIS